MKAKHCILSIALMALGPVWAHQESSHGHAAHAPAQQQAWGVAGTARQVTRTITLDMGDDMRFKPGHLDIRQGETVRLRVRNTGRLLHELVLGTRKDFEAHAAEMRKNPGMSHEEAHMVHVAPGQTGELIWTFNRSGSFEFACLVAGHYEAGMKGTITVR